MFSSHRPRVLVWFSCGAASAVAARLAVRKYPHAEVLYCDTLKYEHPDNLRFLQDVAQWIGREIKILKSEKYEDIFDVFQKTGWLVGPGGARCTTELKKAVRRKYQRSDDLHIFGLTVDEGKRVERFEAQNPEDCEWILVDEEVSKDDCYQVLQRAGIQIPEMYRLGFNNNNCIGCVKGQQGYWNKIRAVFPEAFERMAKLERSMNVAICKSYAGDGKRKRVFLDELDPSAGRDIKEPDIDCGVLCNGGSDDLISIYEPALPAQGQKNTVEKVVDMPSSFIAFDTETWLTAPGRVAPRLVCMSYDSPAMQKPALLLRDDCYEVVKAWLEEPGLLLVNVRIVYDLAVLAVAFPDLLPLIFRAFEEERIADPCIWEMLYDIATGQMYSGRGYSLADIAKRRLDIDVEGKSGPDVWRFRYQELDGVPLSEWPQAAVDYPLFDAVYSKMLWQEQMKEGVPPDFWRQMRAAWCLHLMECWGVRTDQEAVAALEVQLHEAVDGEIEYLLTTPLYKQAKTKRDGTPGKVSQDNKETALAVALAYTGTTANSAEGEGPKDAETKALLKHLPNRRDVIAHAGAWERAGVLDKIPKTDKGGIGRSELVLRGSGDAVLMRLANISGDKKLLNTYIPLLQQGLINARWNILVNTGRISARKPNLTNQPRKPGVRECYVPRDGWWYLFADYHIAELCSLAQVLLDRYGESEMANVIRRGRDIHLEIAAAMAGIPYEEAVRLYKAGDKNIKRLRQLAKVLDFGLPGGMGIAKFFAHTCKELADKSCKDCWGVGLIGEDACHCLGIPQMSMEYVRYLKEDVWLDRFPEMRWYFRDIGQMVEEGGGKATVEQHRSGRLRGGVGYCDGANGFFQSLTADGAKRAMWLITNECYLDTSSPLYGCRPVLFIHDEFGLEVPADYARARPAAKRLSDLMVQGMAEFVPDVPIKAEAALMERWYKQAEPVHDENGELMLWKP